MNAATTWLAERTASLLPQASDTVAGCNCSFFYWTWCDGHTRQSCSSCYPCRAASCINVGHC